MTRYVALLRGINVGGNNLIKMPALKACFEAEGFADVVTYIASGNVLFSSGEAGPQLVRRIEETLGAAFGYQATVMLRSHKQLRAIVGRAPKGFGSEPARYRYDVVFLSPTLTAVTAMKSVTTREGVDEAHPGSGVIYFSRLIARATQSRLSKVVSLPIYKDMTIRNWNTTTALLRLMDAGSPGK